MVFADSIRTPFAANHFEIIICASLIEHVSEPDHLVEEMGRILTPNGIAYISFPPFYSINGGHQFSPFHLLGERFALWALRKRKPLSKAEWWKKKIPTAPSGYHEAFGEWGLYRRTIAQVERLIPNHGLVIMDRSTRWIPMDFSGIPILREILTWHVQFLVKKQI